MVRVFHTSLPRIVIVPCQSIDRNPKPRQRLSFDTNQNLCDTLVATCIILLYDALSNMNFFHRLSHLYLNVKGGRIRSKEVKGA